MLVTIDRVGAEGDGVGRLPDGTPLYVPLTLPGEHVTAGMLRRRGEGWHAAAESVDAPSPARVQPPCRHFGHCGGCVLQHWQDVAYRIWKAGLLEAALRSAGFTPPGPIELAPGLPGERRRLDFAVRRAGGRIVLGLHGPRSAEVVDLTDCLVLHPTLLALLAPLRALLHGLRAIRRQGEVVINLLDSGPDLLLRSDAAPSLEDRDALTAFARAHDLPRVSWAHTGDSPRGGSSSGGSAGGGPAGDGAEAICILRPATTTLSGIAVRPPPGAFLQATVAGERAIVDAVLRGLAAGLTSRPSGRPRIAELYAGIGSLTFALAGLVPGAVSSARVGQLRVAAWEGDAASVGALKQAINQGGLAGRVEATQRDLARQPLSAKELSGFSAVVLDPPHAGAAAQIAQIAAAGVATVVYVSCNPATLGRDAKVLHAAGYALGAATAIDRFLWSARLESVGVFRR
jgi:23S rRNA (uracil1939-C5)-methyltransferase